MSYSNPAASFSGPNTYGALEMAMRTGLSADLLEQTGMTLHGMDRLASGGGTHGYYIGTSLDLTSHVRDEFGNKLTGSTFEVSWGAACEHFTGGDASYACAGFPDEIRNVGLGTWTSVLARLHLTVVATEEAFASSDPVGESPLVHVQDSQPARTLNRAVAEAIHLLGRSRLSAAREAYGGRVEELKRLQKRFCSGNAESATQADSTFLVILDRDSNLAYVDTGLLPMLDVARHVHIEARTGSKGEQMWAWFTANAADFDLDCTVWADAMGTWSDDPADLYRRKFADNGSIIWKVADEALFARDIEMLVAVVDGDPHRIRRAVPAVGRLSAATT
ncbi:MAG: hypothetical protein GY882_00205 [Actinomycetia bacterium]|nr:hypothetical protein [Actinomycetes bacterium]MCP4846155.1 hypothetical protein [Actinomycetes bacterium]